MVILTNIDEAVLIIEMWVLLLSFVWITAKPNWIKPPIINKIIAIIFQISLLKIDPDIETLAFSQIISSG